MPHTRVILFFLHQKVEFYEKKNGKLLLFVIFSTKTIFLLNKIFCTLNFQIKKIIVFKKVVIYSIFFYLNLGHKFDILIRKVCVRKFQNSLINILINIYIYI